MLRVLLALAIAKAALRFRPRDQVRPRQVHLQILANFATDLRLWTPRTAVFLLPYPAKRRKISCTIHSKMYGKIILNCTRHDVSSNPPHDSDVAWSNKQKDAVAQKFVHLTKQFVAT